jgi:hypothetical protein
MRQRGCPSDHPSRGAKCDSPTRDGSAGLDLAPSTGLTNILTIGLLIQTATVLTSPTATSSPKQRRICHAGCRDGLWGVRSYIEPATIRLQH